MSSTIRNWGGNDFKYIFYMIFFLDSGIICQPKFKLCYKWPLDGAISIKTHLISWPNFPHDESNKRDKEFSDTEMFEK